MFRENKIYGVKKFCRTKNKNKNSSLNENGIKILNKKPSVCWIVYKKYYACILSSIFVKGMVGWDKLLL